jgi:hypothetical protein
VILATTIALLVMPLLVLRGRTLVRYYGVDAATWLFAWLLWRRLPGFDPYLGCVVVAVAKVATLSLFIAVGEHVRWSANRAALVALIVYGLTIPAMLRTPIDGDEPFYLLMTESLVHDRDLDLANQYAALERSASGRTDLRPFPDDPKGPNGEQYSRHEPFLALVLIPGYLLGGLHGAIATIALFGVLLVRSTIRWMEDEGIPDGAARAVFPLFAFGPPVLFYATRIWPEVPAAFFFVEALRGMRNERMKRWLPAVLALVLLKLRFVLVVIGIVASSVLRAGRASTRYAFLAIAIVLVPLGVMWFLTGSATSVHSWGEVLPAPGPRYVTGFMGLLSDGMGGIPFQAPFYLLGLVAILRWRSMPRGFRMGILAAALYVLYLLPRPEWHGGWAPPLRYLVFLMPVLALGAASLWDRVSGGVVAIVSAWTIGLVIHGIAYPWRLFHEANGENAVGEWLSTLYHADFSRLFPSFIRMNEAAWIGAIAVILLLVIGPQASRLLGQRRPAAGAALVIALFALVLAAGFRKAMQPPSHVELEDAHVVNRGADLYPELYTVLRSSLRGGRILETNDSLSFLARSGTWRLDAITGLGATIEIEGQTIHIAPDPRYQSFRVKIPRSGRVTMRCLSGALNVDRMTLDE